MRTFQSVIENVRSKSPLVHFITNYVTVNDCANIALATGGSPIMADDILEVGDITSICSSLVINTGTLSERAMRSMLAAGKKANELGHPVVLDPVGAGASAFRNEAVARLLREIKFTVIRGNISEIKFLATGGGSTRGVDASAVDAVTAENLEGVIALAKSLSKTKGGVIVITGAIDIVAEQERVCIIRNGHPLMSRVSGQAACYPLLSVVTSVLILTMFSTQQWPQLRRWALWELAYKKLAELAGGTSTYRMLLIDYMSKMNADLLRSGAKVESR